MNAANSLIPLILQFLPQKRNLLIPLGLSGIMQQRHDGGTSEWRVNRHRAQRCVFTVCTRNRYPKVPTPREGTEPHRSAFLLGRVRDVVTSPGPMPKRYLIQFSKYALLDIPEVWVKGTQGGVRYKTTLEELESIHQS